MNFPERVYGIHPNQDDQSFEEYLNLVLLHYAMVAFKMDYKQEFDQHATQNIFIYNLDNPKLLWSKVNRERYSFDQSVADKYKNGNFLNTLGERIDCLQSKYRLPSYHQSSSNRD